MQQPTTRAPDVVASQRDGNDVEGPSTRVLPEVAFIETLSTIRSLPDFSQRLATVNEYGQTLLHLAVHLRYRKLAQQLVEWGVGLDVQDINGFTALHCAYLCEDRLVVTILKQSGASVSNFDTLGRLPSDLLAKPVAIDLDVEMADAADSDTMPHSRASSENLLDGSMQEHEDAVMERAGCSTADEAFSPPMSPHSSDQKPATNASADYPSDSPSPSGLRGCHQSGSSLAPYNLVTPLKRSRDRLTTPPVQAQLSSELQVDIAEKATATLNIPVLDAGFWDQTLKPEKVEEELATGHEHINEERLPQFIERLGDKSYKALLGNTQGSTDLLLNLDRNEYPPGSSSFSDIQNSHSVPGEHSTSRTAVPSQSVLSVMTKTIR